MMQHSSRERIAGFDLGFISFSASQLQVNGTVWPEIRERERKSAHIPDFLHSLFLFCPMANGIGHSHSGWFLCPPAILSEMYLAVGFIDGTSQPNQVDR